MIIDTDILRDCPDRVWSTEDGAGIRWRDMSPTHLRNTAKFIRNQHSEQESSAWRAYGMVQGEQAEYAIESALSSMEESRADVDMYADEMEAYADFKEWLEHKKLAKLFR